MPELVGEDSANLAELDRRVEQLERQPGKQQPEADRSAGRVQTRLRVESPSRLGFQRDERMLEGQVAILHAWLTAEIAIRPTRDQVKNPLFIQCRIGIESEVAVHEAKSTLPRHEPPNNRPRHRRRRRQDFRQVVSAPNRAFRITLRRQSRDLFAANFFEFDSQ